MADLQFEGRFFFRHIDAGWMEHYWIQAGDLPAALIKFDSILGPRLGLAPSSVSVVRAEVSQLGVRGDVILDTPMPQVGTWPESPNAYDPNVGLLLTMDGSPLFRNRKFFRGVPELVIVNGVYDPTLAGWPGRVTAFANSLVANIAVAHRTAVGPPPVYNMIPVTHADFERVAGRKAGRPFGLRVGRRPIR